MLIPVSWLKEFVDIDIPVELLAEKLTAAGLEVGHIIYYGLPQTMVEGLRYPKSDHLVWDREKLVLGAIKEVKAHPDADRLVLAMVDYGGAELEQCVTGAPNLLSYKDQGPLDPPLWTAFAKEGAEVWDGHSETPKRMILKEKALRGIPNKSMVCSAYELGLSEDHDGIILMKVNPGFPAGTPIVDVLGDVVLEIELTPNLARCYSVFGVAREIAALLDKPLREIRYNVLAEGAPIEGQVKIDIQEPSLNPRFTLALLRDTKIQDSPEWIQRRLQLVGQRPINNIVDVTNYVMFEMGQPLHAFDYDKLKARVNGGVPTIITRLPKEGETLETLDQVKRVLEPHNILVCDTEGVLSIGGIIGGADTEIDANSTNVLLEAANWNFINVRQTMHSQKAFTDAGTRFSRGVHPAQALLGLQQGIEMMRQVGGGQVAEGIIDSYPNPAEKVHVDLKASEIQRILGIEVDADVAAGYLRRAGFTVEVKGNVLSVDVPENRLDISSDSVIGQADLIEEIGRVYGLDEIPNTIIADMMPEQWINEALESEEKARDVLIALGLREQISYRLTTREHEALLTPTGQAVSIATGEYVELLNPISPDKVVMRHSLLTSLLDNAKANARFQTRQQVFEIGSIYLGREGQALPEEPRRLGVLMIGPRTSAHWAGNDDEAVNFYDLKGVVEGLMGGLHIQGASYQRANHSSFHPGRSAELHIQGKAMGVFGEVHPLVARAFDFDDDLTLLAAEFDLDALLAHVDPLHTASALPTTPPILQDIALVVKEDVDAAAVEAVIRKAGGALLKAVSLFDVYRGNSIPEGHKSLAYSLTYQTNDRTLTDQEVAKVQEKIVKLSGRELDAKLRS